MEASHFRVRMQVRNGKLVIPLTAEFQQALQELGWRDGDEIDVRIEGKQIILQRDMIY